MKQQTKSSNITVGLDLGDRRHRFCALDERGEVVEEGSICNERDSLRKLAGRYHGALGVMEATARRYLLEHYRSGRATKSRQSVLPPLAWTIVFIRVPSTSYRHLCQRSREDRRLGNTRHCLAIAAPSSAPPFFKTIRWKSRGKPRRRIL